MYFLPGKKKSTFRRIFQCFSRTTSLTKVQHCFKDPREALIVALKREVSILTLENNHLRQVSIN